MRSHDLREDSVRFGGLRLLAHAHPRPDQVAAVEDRDAAILQFRNHVGQAAIDESSGHCRCRNDQGLECAGQAGGTPLRVPKRAPLRLAGGGSVVHVPGQGVGLVWMSSVPSGSSTYSRLVVASMTPSASSGAKCRMLPCSIVVAARRFTSLSL